MAGDPQKSRLLADPIAPNVKKLILWDIDGTLIVSHGAGVRAMERALTERFGVSCDLGQIDLSE